MRRAVGALWLVSTLACSGVRTPTESPAPSRSSSPAPAEPPKVDGNQRLSAQVEPRKYELAFNIDPAEDRFSARSVIEVVVHEPTRFVHLHARELEFGSVRARVRGEWLTPTLITGENGGIALAFDDRLSGTVLLDFEHSAALDEVPMSLYRAGVGDDWYAFTQFEPVAARDAFPCFDEPGFKTPFSIEITVPQGMTAVSNAPLEGREKRAEAEVFRFRTTRPLPTYLVALAVGRFDIVAADPNTAGSVPSRIVTTRGQSEHTRFALEQTRLILDTLVRYFGIPYPYQKLDQVAVPSFNAGAMENAGLVTYRERFLIVDPERLSAPDELRAQSIMAHELAHMWFGNLVTMQWWDDLWLNEAFATWMSSRVLRDLAPRAEPALLAVRDKVGVMARDALPSSTPIRKTIRDEGDIRNAFDPITYQKGQAVLGMLESWVGEEPFRQGVQRYLERHQWKNATMFDLFRALDEASNEPVSEVGRRFVEQAGVPLVEVDYSCDAQGVRLSLAQSRYHAEGAAPVVAHRWQVPLCVRWQKGKSEGRDCFVLGEARAERTLDTPACPDYVHPNADETGYYRWALPDAKLLSLAKVHLGELTAAERLALPAHALSSLEAGRLDAASYVDLLTALARDDHWLTVEAVASGVSMIARWPRDPASHEALATWARRVLGPHEKRIGFDPKPGEPPSHGLLRDTLFTALVEAGADDEFTKLALGDVRRVVQDPSRPVGALGLKLAIAARAGDAELHAGLVRALGTVREPQVREYLVRALGHFPAPLLARSYDLLLDGTLRAQDFWAVTRAAGGDSESQAALWNWFVAHEQRLLEVLGDRVSASLPWVLAGFCDEAALEQARHHFDDIERYAVGAQHNLAQALETANRCVALQKRHRAAILARVRQLTER